jgi:hypothetical protein
LPVDVEHEKAIILNVNIKNSGLKILPLTSISFAMGWTSVVRLPGTKAD